MTKSELERALAGWEQSRDLKDISIIRMPMGIMSDLINDIYMCPMFPPYSGYQMDFVYGKHSLCIQCYTGIPETVIVWSDNSQSPLLSPATAGSAGQVRRNKVGWETKLKSAVTSPKGLGPLDRGSRMKELLD